MRCDTLGSLKVYMHLLKPITVPDVSSLFNISMSGKLVCATIIRKVRPYEGIAEATGLHALIWDYDLDRTLILSLPEEVSPRRSVSCDESTHL